MNKSMAQPFMILSTPSNYHADKSQKNFDFTPHSYGFGKPSAF